MKKVKLGRTSLEVSQLGLGGLFVSKHGSGYEQARAAIHRAVELGVNFIDTAPGYFNSEEVIGRALADVDQPLIISTKLGGRPQPFDPQNAEELRISVEQSLEYLGRDCLDMLLIHEPDRPGQYDWWTDWEEVRGPVLDVIEGFRKQGIVKYTGLGGTTAYEMAHFCRSGKFDVVLTAFNYSLLWREAEQAVLPAAIEQEMGIIIGSPLQQGALARRYDATLDNPPAWLSPARANQFRALYALLDEIKMPLPELAIRFTLSNPAVHTILMGARAAEEVEQNVASVEAGPLDAELLARLDEIAAMVAYRPYEEPFGMGNCMANPTRYRGPGMA